MRAVLQNNPSIKAARADWQAARERIPQASAWEDPKFTVSSRIQRFVPMEPNAMADQMLSVEQMIPLSGKNRSRARVAAAELIAAGEALRRRELEAIAEVRGVYFEWLKYNALLKLNFADLESARQTLENNRARLAVAAADNGEVLDAQSEIAMLEENSHVLAEQLGEQQTRLNVLMNRDAFLPIVSLNPVPDAPLEKTFDTEKLRALALKNRPEVRMAEAKVTAAKELVQLAHREWIPDPAVSVQAQRYNAASQAVSEVDAGISFSMPWFNAGKYRAGEREAGANLEAANAALEAARNEALGLLRNQLNRLAAQAHHVAIYRDDLIPNARQIQQSMQAQYQSGRAGFSEVLSAQRKLRELQSGLEERRADYLAALAELESITGADLQLFPGAITSTSTPQSHE